MATKYLSAAETAKLVRTVLKANFAGVKFSVRSDTYSGGASIRINWTDGPTERAVQGIVDQFQGADFDGMIDLKTHRPNTILDGQVVHFGADYIFCSREYSDAARLNAAMRFEQHWGREYDPSTNYGSGNGPQHHWDGQQILWREFLAPVDLR
jgi:Large polyvalent protein associated domain 29